VVPTVMPTYGRIDIAFEKGEGPYLYTADGRRYLDFASGIATNSLGHCHPHLVKTVQEQAARLWHVSNLYNIPEQQKLADRLVETSFADTVFFCNSGAEALEGSTKVARRYHFHHGNPHKTRIVCCSHSFHGRTLGMLSATDKDAYREGFGPRVAGFSHVAFGNLNEMRAAIDDDVAAILVEPVQGEGGVNTASLDYLRALREIADEFGILLIFDEVQCGAGRSGKLWAYEWAGVAPDIMATAKGIGGGFPIGAVMASEAAASGMKPGLHGSTFGGNPLACSAANAVLDVLLEPGFLEQVDRTARYLWDRLVPLPGKYGSVIKDVRGAGMLLGLHLAVPNGEVMTRLREDHNLLTVVAANNVLRLLPPLTIDTAQADEAVEAIEAMAAGMARHAA